MAWAGEKIHETNSACGKSFGGVTVIELALPSLFLVYDMCSSLLVIALTFSPPYFLT